jgi:RND family efflux transporter MFP subunit
MWTWRVIFPGVGLIASSLILWNASRPVDSRQTMSLTPARPTSASGRVIAEGRIVARPGAMIEVGSELGGLVGSVAVAEKAKVKKGDWLVEFRPDDAKLAVAEAEARLGEADAELIFCQAELARKNQIKPTTPANDREIEANRRDVQVAVARRKLAELTVTRAKLALSRLKILAPIDGVVLGLAIQPGEIAAPGARLLTICDLSRVRIEAEVDEFDVGRIQVDDPVAIHAEGQEGSSWRGTVEEIPDRVAAREITPGDPGRPSDTKVLLVKIRLNQPIPLKLGQQVEVEIRPVRQVD